MKKARTPENTPRLWHSIPLLARLCLLALPVLMLGGCAMTLNPPDHRARQYSAHFDEYSDKTRQRLREATVAIGDDRIAVYIALGTPHNRRIGYERDEETGAALGIELWDYSGYPVPGIEGRFVTLNNSGFASPIRFTPYGKVTIVFANGILRRYTFYPDEDPEYPPNHKMALPLLP